MSQVGLRARGPSEASFASPAPPSQRERQWHVGAGLGHLPWRVRVGFEPTSLLDDRYRERPIFRAHGRLL